MKYKRILGYGGLGLTLIALGVAFVKPISTSNLLIRARADMGNLSVVFNNRSTVESGSIQSSSCVLSSGLQMSGIKAYATISNSSNPQFAEISRFYGDVASVVFSVDSPASNFRSLKSIGFTYRNTSYQGNMNIMWSSDNSNWTTITVACGTASQALPSGAHYLKVVNVNNSGYAYFTAFTLNYSCSDDPEEKELSSISVSGQTPEFTVGDTFSFGGTVTAHYSDSSSADVTNSATFSGYNMSQAGEQTVTVSYTEGAITKEAAYDITVADAGGTTVADNLVSHGTFNMTCSQSSQIIGELTFATLSSGTIVVKNTNLFTAWTETQTFNWSISNDCITVSFTNVSSPAYSSHAHLESTNVLTVTFDGNNFITALSLPLTNSQARTLVYSA